MWSPWISLVIMSLWLLLSLHNYSGGTYIFISLDLIRILSCSATLFFNICISHQLLSRHMVTVLSIMDTIRRVTRVTQVGEWLHIWLAAACASHVLVFSIPARANVHRRKKRHALQRWEWWKINNFSAHPMTVKLLQVIYFPSASVWWYTALLKPLGLCEHMVHFRWRDKNLKRKEKNDMDLKYLFIWPCLGGGLAFL